MSPILSVRGINLYIFTHCFFFSNQQCWGINNFVTTCFSFNLCCTWLRLVQRHWPVKLWTDPWINILIGQKHFNQNGFQISLEIIIWAFPLCLKPRIISRQISAENVVVVDSWQRIFRLSTRIVRNSLYLLVFIWRILFFSSVDTYDICNLSNPPTSSTQTSFGKEPKYQEWNKSQTIPQVSCVLIIVYGDCIEWPTTSRLWFHLSFWLI